MMAAVWKGSERQSLLERGGGRNPGGDERREEEQGLHLQGVLARYVRDAKSKRAIPVVLSLIPRNMWQGEKVNRASNNYGKWAREAAQAEGAFFLDLNEVVAKRYEAEGKEKVQTAYFDPATTAH